MPADFSRGIASGDGASIQSTCPVNSAAVRVDEHLDIQEDVVGGDVAAVMEGDALPQMDDPALVVLRVDLIGGRQSRLDLRRLVRLRQIPQQEPVVKVVADEAIPLETLIRV